MRVILCAAGSGSRWNNYLGRRKHLAPVDGEPILLRTVRLLRERGVDDIWVTHTAEYPYHVAGAQSFERPAGLTNNEARRETAPLWSRDGRTIILWADSYFTDAALDLILEMRTGWTLYARLSPSQVTGKPGPEIFGVGFDPADHAEYCRALEGNADARWSSWVTYAAMVGHAVNVEPKDIRNWGRCVEIPDDITDDFDFGDDYERWMFRFAGRSARRVVASDFDQPWFKARTRELNATPKLHRKLWEHCSIAQAYRDRVGEGGDVLGFGVGREPLPAWFASRGANVVASDRPEADIWLARQHASGLADLRREGICTEEEFSRVNYLPCDMRQIPESLTGQFDMTWSSSCMEHLGGIRAGLEFFLAQMKCLKQGGIAVHTTEYNTRSNGQTVDSKDLAFFRGRDLIELTQRMHAQGDRLWPINLVAGTSPADLYVDQPPYQMEPHLQLALGGHAFTSVMLIGAKG